MADLTGDFTRKLGSNQKCEIHIFDITTGEDRLLFSTTELLLEAPNWHKNNYLLLNGNGLLWKLDVADNPQLQKIELDGANPLNNDHVLSPDHSEIYISTNNDWRIHRVPVSGGRTQRVSFGPNSQLHFLHGVHPNKAEIAFVQLDAGADDVFSSGRIQLLDVSSGEVMPLVNGNGPEDGCEYSVDGEWVYFNTEHFSTRRGHAQIARARRSGADFEQLTFDNRVNWSPHQSPDGLHWVYLSYPSETVGHPENLDVELRLAVGDDWGNPKTLVKLFGGQGTINVNSWSPHEAKFAYVSYPKI